MAAFAFLFVMVSASVSAAGGGGFIIEEYLPAPPLVAGNYTPEDATALKCSTLTTISERVGCRLDLTYENELAYLPEECRALEGTPRAECKQFYSSVQQCWSGVNMADPVDCARRSLGLGKNISADLATCTGEDTCIGNITQRTHSLIKFRMYNLEWKAEYLLEDELPEIGVHMSRELLVDLVVNLELKKQEYNEAKTLAEKKVVLQGARSLWQSFGSKVKQEVGI
jgi:hypothetical protein